MFLWLYVYVVMWLYVYVVMWLYVFVVPGKAAMFKRLGSGAATCPIIGRERHGEA